eukprot:CAMPEP_0114436072 /NCGR_PEP_ID=MMETSP0103-20121206/13229_1 /TAXON_ID=37642 ORGANISM="Paraphysomonas imperforata, Strain PA2" /NCGR_SAMPLE_ID=MMETSP0103 /ASSEMBLY_ACC=CAM_ASM_000201 /LENGTH=38 /DNA_ID= /DNA_START= /DNA_END= /DNA_ORIENTATION=
MALRKVVTKAEHWELGSVLPWAVKKAQMRVVPTAAQMD